MPVSEYTPTVASVAAILRARTKTRGGKEAGTFNPASAVGTADETRPTEEQVILEISNSLGHISGIIGADIDERFQDSASRAAALRTALLIELSYFPEQVATGRSPYVQLKELYDEEWATLLDAMGLSPDAGGGVVAPDAGYPSAGGFPTTAIGMETAW